MEELDGLKKSLHNLTQEINQTLLNAINARLKMAGDVPTWVPLIELFVGLVLNKEAVTLEDVQHTLRDAKSLNAKMSAAVASP